MKKIILFSLLLCLFVSAHSQSDTLYTKRQQKIPCKIVEISELEVKYKRVDLPDGPTYVINKTTLTRYTLANGQTEQIVPDELSIENEHGDILKNRSVIKINPFSPVNDQISFAYEKVLKIGMNLDIEAGYSNSNIMHGDEITGTLQNYFHSGAYIKPGVKFFLGQDYSVRGMKYAHPLKGRYIKLELAASFVNYDNVKRTETFRSNTYPYTITQTVSTDIKSIAYGGFVNYGRQFILGNVLTLEYYVGLGFTGQSNSYSNPAYTKPMNGGYNYYGDIFDDAKRISNYHGFIRASNMGLSVTGGFRIGYIIPDKCTKTKKEIKTN